MLIFFGSEIQRGFWAIHPYGKNLARWQRAAVTSGEIWRFGIAQRYWSHHLLTAES
jgi:hypothetical protein